MICVNSEVEVMTSKINKDIFSQNFHWNAMFGCIKKYMTCGSKIGRLQSQKKYYYV